MSIDFTVYLELSNEKRRILKNVITKKSENKNPAFSKEKGYTFKVFNTNV